MMLVRLALQLLNYIPRPRPILSAQAKSDLFLLTSYPVARILLY